MFKGKKILVAGGTGMIGVQLVELLLKEGASVRIASMDDPKRAHKSAEFIRADLTNFDNCAAACKDMEIVFNLTGVKGSPAVSTKKPASFFVPMMMININLMEAARRAAVERFQYTSSVGVYAPAEVFYEDDVWKTFPSENDRFPGWAKRMGELQGETYKIEYGWDKVTVVRPANVYGPLDNFEGENAMVVPSLIRRAVNLSGTEPLVCWGDGSPIRDFIYSRDVARGMMIVMEKNSDKPVNLGSGTGVTIRQLVEAIVKALGRQVEIVWDVTKPAGDKKRLMDMARAKSLGFEPAVSLEQGIRETIDWYLANRSALPERYDVFKKST